MLDLKTLRETLFRTAYQMLGEVEDAEDVVQEVLVDLSQKIATDKVAAIENLNGYYVRATVYKSINYLKIKKRSEYPGVWLPEPYIFPSHLEHSGLDVSFGFVHLLSKLNPNERAVFILRESFEMSFKEIAMDLPFTEANCRKLYQRSKEKIQHKAPLNVVDQHKKEALTQQFLHSVRTGDMEALLQLLVEEITIYSDGGGKVAAATVPIQGVERCIKFLLGIQKQASSNIRVEIKNSESNILILLYEASASEPYTVVVLDASEDKIRTIYLQRNPDKLKFL
ncbi:sigma factor-like helix-turn-helix DNA-binding protein [Rapidithrix thailandica]|uniref:Sigma factor-like helix-turn-helix DNA-binding protein n=1 Tax=Rapidithrix thailandica TaxID=413964 RepID=A0AAW9SJR4_9BACT